MCVLLFEIILHTVILSTWTKYLILHHEQNKYPMNSTKETVKSESKFKIHDD